MNTTTHSQPVLNTHSDISTLRCDQDLKNTRQDTASCTEAVSQKYTLLPKSKALLRVLDQANEDTRLADVEMKRECLQVNNEFAQNNTTPSILEDWYECSKLNPEIEMTYFQLISTSRKCKIRKVPGDRFKPYYKIRRQQHHASIINLQEASGGFSRLSINE